MWTYSTSKLVRMVSPSPSASQSSFPPFPQANPPGLDRVEDIVNLVHLNESSVLHVLRQRYGSSLIHTFAGKHLIVINPLRPLSSYVDRVRMQQQISVVSQAFRLALTVIHGSG